MPPRSSWKGFLRLSLVSVTVKAFTASSSGSDIRLNQLHKDCHSPIKYQKVCPLHGELDSDSIVSGYQYAKGQYVVIDPDELSQLRRESDKAIDIDGFYPADSVDPVYLSGKNYYLVPDGLVGQKAYHLLHHVMSNKDLFALAHVVLSGREQLVLVRPMSRLLVMSVLNYAAQVKQPAAFEDEVGDVAFADDEVRLTEKLVEATSADELDLSKYRNAHTEKLTQLIEAKVEGKEIVAAPPAEEPKVIELMEALKASVARVQGSEAVAPGRKAAKSKKGKKPPTKKMAPSARKTAPRKRKTKSG